jgi:hypothetical protein
MKVFTELMTAGNSRSSTRFVLLLWGIAIGSLIGAIAFHIMWRTVVPYQVIWLAPGKLEVVQFSIEWTGLGVAIGAILGGAAALLWGKSKTKEQENKDPQNQPPNDQT